MLRIPAFRKIGDLTAYQDDGIWNRFSLIPSLPTIRCDENGRPIFLLTIFHTSDQAREANPQLARAAINVSCDGRRLTEVRICLTKELTFRSCPEMARYSCRRDKVVMPAVRGR